MKKVMILSAAALMLSLAMPQFAEATNVQNSSTLIQVQQVKYQDVTVADIPEAVSTTIKKDYAGYTIDKAFKGSDGTYKVAVTKVDVKEVLFFDAQGGFIKAEKSAVKASAPANKTATPADKASTPAPVK